MRSHTRAATKGALVSTVLALIAATVGCASTPSAAPTSSPEPVSSTSTDSLTSPAPSVDAAAQTRVDGWLDSAPMPEGAVRVETEPDGAGFLSTQGWVCSPMATAEGYWVIPATSFVAAYNWLVEHPGPGLIALGGRLEPASEGTDSANLGNVPELGALEGVAFEMVHLDDGVAIRAEGGAFTETTVCPTPDPGTSYGSPGEG